MFGITKYYCVMCNSLDIDGTACPTLMSPANGNLILSEGLAIYRCKATYLIQGSIVRYCSDDGQWSSEQPICKGKEYKQCLPLHGTALE